MDSMQSYSHTGVYAQPYELSYHPSVYPPSTSQHQQLPRLTLDQQQALLENALKSAWDQYGPSNKQRIENTVRSPSQSAYSHRDTSSVIPLIGFQPSASEWDHHIIAQVERNPPVPPPPPSIFTRFLSSYIDFEVNYHEVADIMRRAVALFFVGAIIFAWICLGGFLGLFPLKMFGARDISSGSIDSLKLFRMDNTKDLTDRVFLALNGDWLKVLQDRLDEDLGSQLNKSQETWIQCCVTPDDEGVKIDQNSTATTRKEGKGTAECQIVEKKKTMKKAKKCTPDLTYNFKFGPRLQKVQKTDITSSKEQF